MVTTVKCEHCGLETSRPVVKNIGGRDLNFCCHGCAAVYEMLFQEGLLEQVKEEEKKDKEKK
jgi:hypothetical protein